jgi:hypothetical protein
VSEVAARAQQTIRTQAALFVHATDNKCLTSEAVSGGQKVLGLPPLGLPPASGPRSPLLPKVPIEGPANQYHLLCDQWASDTCSNVQ